MKHLLKINDDVYVNAFLVTGAAIVEGTEVYTREINGLRLVLIYGSNVEAQATCDDINDFLSEFLI